jgi:hypothetical protein
MDAWLEEINDGRKETTACQEAMEAILEKLEANPGGLQSYYYHFDVKAMFIQTV